ncbi:MAG: tetratricopeptide repeat protein, partial [Armatimonadetes bacterium]|nr:tetratricopeptide repeat protein [Armatimonadota bacterium]
HHAGAGQPFTLSFDPEKIDGHFRLAVKVRDAGGPGGILGPMTLEKPRMFGEQEALNIALARHALGRDADALMDYQEWIQNLPKESEKRDRVIPFQNWIYAAQNNLERLAANPPVKPSAEYLVLLGLVQERQGRHDQAEMSLKKAIQVDELDRNSYLALARFYERRNNWKEAHDTYLRLMDVMRGAPDEGHFKAYLVSLTNDRWGNRGRARELIAKYVQEYPDSPAWNRLYADHLYDYDPRDAQTNATAITHYQKWYLMNDGLDPWHAGYRLWDLLVRTGNLPAAQGFCQIWLNKFENHPQKPDMLYRLAETRRLLGQQNEAERVQALATFQQLQRDFPASGGTINAIQNVIGNYPIADALEMVNQWEKDNPRHDATAVFLWPLGYRMESDKEYGVEKAMDLYRRVWNDYRSKWAENLYAFDRLGNHLWSQKKYAEATALYGQVMNHFGGNGHGQIVTAWHRFAQQYGSEVFFQTEVDSTHPQFDKARLTDGQTNGNQGHPSWTWCSADTAEDHWVDCLLPAPEELRMVQVWWGHEGQLPRQVKLQVREGERYLDAPGHEAFQSPGSPLTTWMLPRVKADRLRLLLKAGGGPEARPGILQVAEIRISRHVRDDLWTPLEAHYRRMMSAYAHTGEHWNAGLALSQACAGREEFLQADIELQKLLYALPVNHAWFWDAAVQEAKARMDRQRYGEAAAVFRTLLNRHRGIDSTRRMDAERLMGQCLSKSGEDYAAIDPNLPESGLLWGNVFARNGEEDLAWDRFEQNRSLFPEHQHKLSFEYIGLIARRLLARKETAAAIDVCKQFLIKRKDDRQVTDSERAQIQLLIGDAHYRDERYEIAREEYNTVLTLPEYRHLPEAVEARFKVATTLMSQKIFGKAEEIFNELTRNPNEDTNARAHLMLGILYHAQDERKKAEEKFKEVLALAPRSETADEIIYRLGIVYQEGKKYKEALDALRLIGAWSGDSKKVVEPGRMLRVRLSDRDLTIARGATEVPVLVTTSAGDRERVLLEKSEVGRGLFVAEVETVLGTPTPDDRKLQVMGRDTITYRYDPQWAKDFKILDQDAPPPVITIAADATLKISPTEIKEEEETKISPDLFVGEEPKRRGYRLFRDEKQIKPGNNVYIRVLDGDQDVSDQADRVECTAEASSGDTVIFPLMETGPHTGIFKGALATGARPPDALASDSTEGREAWYAIDGDASARSSWVGTLDARAPKWIRIDLKEVYRLSRFEWNVGVGIDPKEDRAPIRYVIEGSRDKLTWFPIAEEPPKQGLRIRGAVGIWDPDGLRHLGTTPEAMLEGDDNTTSRWVGKDNQAEWVLDVDLGQITEVLQTVLRNHDQQYEVKQYALYTEKEIGKYPGQDRGLDRWVMAYRSPVFDQPRADTVAFTVPEQPKPAQRSQPLKSRYLRLVISQAFQSHPEIGELEITPRLDFQMEKSNEGIGASFRFSGVEARFVRMTVHEFHNDAPAIASITINDHEGRRLVPTGQNLRELAANTVLELTPGDEITVSYRDEKNIHPGEPKIYRESLSATFFNGLVRPIVHEWIEDEQGNRHMRDHMVRRIRPGDRFIVQLIDYDEDKTDGIDKLSFTVTSSTGQTKEFEARETDPYSGVFTKEVDTSPEEKSGAVTVGEGQSLTLSYVDVDNTDPGNRTPRTSSLDVAVPTPGKVRILPNLRTDYMSRETAESGDRPQKLVAVERDMEVEVVDPDAALHSGNTVKVRLATTSGTEIDVECAILGGGLASGAFSGYREYHRALVNALDVGLFRGRIRVVLGDKKSPTVDVLNVMGGDTINARYADELTPDNPLPTDRYDSARILSDAEFGIFDDEFENRVESVHVGEKFYLQVIDPDMDRSEERDTVMVTLQATFDEGAGDTLAQPLVETLSHSGIFTASVPIVCADSATPANDSLEANFGSRIRAVYFDKYNTVSGVDAVELDAAVEVVTGTDGEMMAFSRRFPTDDMATETQFRIGECYYYLGKEHVELKQSDAGLKELSEGQEILSELLVHHPDSAMVDQIGYLLGNIAQEQNKWEDAILTYRRITRDFPESIVAPDAQYKIAMCYEKKGDFDLACEEYVRLAYKYPDSPLVSDSMIRIGLYYFNKKKYDVALQVFLRFTSKFPEHASVQKVAFKIGLCYILSEQFLPGGEYFKSFVEKFPDSDLKPAALYWAGDSFLKGNDPRHSYQMFKRCIWDFPETKWAKYSRGRLTAPVFDRIQENE